jgi:hypothetical protein
MKSIDKRFYVLSTQLHASGRHNERYLDCAHETAGTLVLTRDRWFAKTFTSAASAYEVVMQTWARYHCALYLREVPCGNFNKWLGESLDNDVDAALARLESR